MHRLANSPVTYMTHDNVMASMVQTPPKVQLRLNIQRPKETKLIKEAKQTTSALSQEYYDSNDDEQKFHHGYGDSHVVSHSERSILTDLRSYPFTDDIKNMADVVYNKMRYQVRRGKIRDQLLFYCVYCAYCELKRSVNPVQLGKSFGLTQGEVQRCDSLFSPLQTGYRKPGTFTTPLSCLPQCCTDIGLSVEATEDILAMASAILAKDPSLMQENPQTVASGLLRYYLVLNGITVENPQDMTNVTGRSTPTIDTLYRRVATVDNS